MPIDRAYIKTAIAMIVLTAAFVFTMWLPQRGRFSAVNAQIAAANRHADEYRANVVKIEKLKKDIARKEQEAAADTEALPVLADAGRVLEQLSRTMAAESFADQEILTRPVNHGVDFARFPLALRFQGSFASLYSFLRELEAYKQIIRIDQLQISTKKSRATDPQDGQSAPVLWINLELSTFSRPKQGSSS